MKHKTRSYQTLSFFFVNVVLLVEANKIIMKSKKMNMRPWNLTIANKKFK